MKPARSAIARCIRRFITLAAAAWFLSNGEIRADDPASATWHSELESAVTGGNTDDGGTSTSFSASAWRQWATGWPDTYWLTGLQLDHYTFADGPIPRLQDYAALLGLQYRRNGETAAQLTLRPGYYFAQHARRDAWDIPVDCVTGIPFTDTFNGVIGFSSGRFYHHPLPIFGLVWDPAPHWHCQLVYPEPALEYAASSTLTLRLAGELVGGGFLNDTPSGGTTPVEYSSYRVGLGATQKVTPHCKLGLMLGVEAMRDFDAFRSTGRTHGGAAGYIGISATLSR